MTDLVLRWNNHGITFVNLLNSLCSKELFYDATIVCHGKYYPVHKLVLSTFSKYFEEIFSRTKCKHPFIIMKDIKSTELEPLLAYMYKGEVNIPQEFLLDLIKAAEDLKISGLALHGNEPIGKQEPESNVSSINGPIDLSNYSLSDKENASKSLKLVDEDSEDMPSTLKERPVSPDHLQSDRSESIYTTTVNSLNNVGQFDAVNPIEVAEVKLEELEEQEPELQISDNLGSYLSQSGCNKPSQEHELDPFHEIDDPDEEPAIKQESDPQSANSNSSLSELNHLAPLSEGCLNACVKGKNKKFKCPYCAYGSKWSGNLNSHMRMKHPKEGDRRFACPYCPYKAVYKSLLKNHIMTHTGEKPFRCFKCPYRTNQKSNLVIHERKHDSNKLYNCQVCDYKTNYKKSMQDHITRHH